MTENFSRPKIKKLDGRFTAHPFFKTALEYPLFDGSEYGSDTDFNFYQMREWLWENYGPSKELGIWIWHQSIELINTDWCWDVDTQRMYLSEKCTSAVILMFGPFNK